MDPGILLESVPLLRGSTVLCRMPLLVLWCCRLAWLLMVVCLPAYLIDKNIRLTYQNKCPPFTYCLYIIDWKELYRKNNKWANYPKQCLRTPATNPTCTRTPRPPSLRRRNVRAWKFRITYTSIKTARPMHSPCTKTPISGSTLRIVGVLSTWKSTRIARAPIVSSSMGWNCVRKTCAMESGTRTKKIGMMIGIDVTLMVSDNCWYFIKCIHVMYYILWVLPLPLLLPAPSPSSMQTRWADAGQPRNRTRSPPSTYQS